MHYNISFSSQTKFFNNAVHGLGTFFVWATKSFFVKNKSEDHSNNKFNDGVDERESQMKANDISTMKIFKWENKQNPQISPTSKWNQTKQYNQNLLKHRTILHNKTWIILIASLVSFLILFSHNYFFLRQYRQYVSYWCTESSTHSFSLRLWPMPLYHTGDSEGVPWIRNLLPHNWIIFKSVFEPRWAYFHSKRG